VVVLRLLKKNQLLNKLQAVETHSLTCHKGGSNPVATSSLSLLPNVQTSSGAHPYCCSMGAGAGVLSRGKAAGA